MQLCFIAFLLSLLYFSLGGIYKEPGSSIPSGSRLTPWPALMWAPGLSQGCVALGLSTALQVFCNSSFCE